MTDKQVRFNLSDSDEDFVVTSAAPFPSTRYQGSKRQIKDWVWNQINQFELDSLLDAFGGTGAIAHQAKRYGIRTLYNDYLTFNHQIGKALIENDRVLLSDDDVDHLMERHSAYDYPSFVANEYEGIYYTDEENRWLDMMHRNIQSLEDEYKRALAYAVLVQACLAKRPYNLFHRANLDLRTRDVDRSFGNKTTWERSFEEHFREKVGEFNDAVFENGRDNRAFNRDIIAWDNPPMTDAVYIDPPYYDRTKESNGGTDYQFYYHFLEGFVQYDTWRDRIDREADTKPIDHDPSPWTDADRVYDAFENVLDTFSDRIIAISYNSAGLPRPAEIESMLQERKDNVEIEAKEHQYVLSEHETREELLFLAYD